MRQIDVYLSLGGNIGNTQKVLSKAYIEISECKDIELIKTSHFYKTSPVSDIPQRDYINCACHIKTTHTPLSLLKILNGIEKKLGKISKEKQKPRIIDIDIIFFGDISVKTKDITIPHKEWKNRLFVLTPLSDLQDVFYLPSENNKKISFNIKKFLNIFENTNNEKIAILN